MGRSSGCAVQIMEAGCAWVSEKKMFGETPPVQRTADVVTLLRECLAHGDGSLYQTDGVEGSCRMVSSLRESRSRQAGGL